MEDELAPRVVLRAAKGFGFLAGLLDPSPFEMRGGKDVK